MNNVSRILQRNLDRLPQGRVLLVDPEPDVPCREITRRGGTVELSTASRRVFRNLEQAGADIAFEAAPVGKPDIDVVVMNLPREKERLDMLLHAAACRLRPDGLLWLVGAKRAGIASSPRRLEQRFGHVSKLDNACHCSLFGARKPVAEEPFRLDRYETAWQISHAGKTLELRSLPGVFAHGRLDPGTALLLETLEKNPVAGRVLDFASGCGVIGAAIRAANTDTEVMLLDDSALAIEAGKRTLAANGLKAMSLASNGFSELSGQYEWIVSNPPFHRGVEQDTGISEDFFRDAGTFLSENGRIRVVFNRHLPYAGWLRQSFNRVDCLARTGTFTVIEASNTK